MAFRKTGSDGVTEWKRKRVTRLDDSQRYCLVAWKKELEHDAIGTDELSKIDKERAGITSMAPVFLAIDLGFTGPTYSISAACATSNNCFCAAANHIREGKVDLMIAGGTESSVVPIGLAGMGAMRALSQRND
ncbi:hypothetical protein L2E82_19426 [Cichorium intybus]|uniref:Uncharacterized protein n=1 Tax=Cichorium intybus TaxID=13427 RepID=A0ACB9FCF1_CICIN|nr:hypothetical protein L2E82_19426 [Cichorium intybus]